MNLISTFISCPDELAIIRSYKIHQLIIDLPFCSIRSHLDHDWHIDDLMNLTQHCEQLMCNLDGIY
ncbi:MAG: hypothetical protein VW397_05465, partial [Candidatus Margulisiibacteriota bacterium]